LNERSNMSPPPSGAPSLVLDMGTAYMKNGVWNRGWNLNKIAANYTDYH
jgi:hypothetical protein